MFVLWRKRSRCLSLCCKKMERETSFGRKWTWWNYILKSLLKQPRRVGRPGWFWSLPYGWHCLVALHLSGYRCKRPNLSPPHIDPGCSLVQANVTPRCNMGDCSSHLPKSDDYTPVVWMICLFWVLDWASTTPDLLMNGNIPSPGQ